MSKDEYNKSLDKQIISLLNLRNGDTYQARDLCQLIYEHKDIIFKVWTKEDSTLTQKRYDLFVKGAIKYL